MDLHVILGRLANTPDAIKVYRDLQMYYTEVGRTEDAQAVDYLIETKFGKKDDAIDGANVSERQLQPDSDLPGISGGFLIFAW